MKVMANANFEYPTVHEAVSQALPVAPIRFDPKNQKPEKMLSYFRHRHRDRYFALKPGKPKHVLSADLILRNEFNFNNERHILAENFDWQSNPSTDLEWLILLHKFYYSRDLALAYDYTRDERYARKWLIWCSRG